MNESPASNDALRMGERVDVHLESCKDHLQLGYTLAVDRAVLLCAENGVAFPAWLTEALAQRSKTNFEDYRLVAREGQKKRDAIIVAALHVVDGHVPSAMTLLEAHHVEPKQKCAKPGKYTVGWLPAVQHTDQDWLWSESKLKQWKYNNNKKAGNKKAAPDPDAVAIFEDYLEDHEE